MGRETSHPTLDHPLGAIGAQFPVPRKLLVASAHHRGHRIARVRYVRLLHRPRNRDAIQLLTRHQTLRQEPDSARGGVIDRWRSVDENILRMGSTNKSATVRSVWPTCPRRPRRREGFAPLEAEELDLLGEETRLDLVRNPRVFLNRRLVEGSFPRGGPHARRRRRVRRCGQ